MLLPEYEVTESKIQVISATWRKLPVFLSLQTVITLFALFGDNTLQDFHLKLCWLFAQVVLYWGLSNRISRSTTIRSDGSKEVVHTATEVATGIVFITLPLLVLLWPYFESYRHVAQVVILKACRWSAVLVLVSQHIGRGLR